MIGVMIGGPIGHLIGGVTGQVLDQLYLALQKLKQKAAGSKGFISNLQLMESLYQLIYG